MRGRVTSSTDAASRWAAIQCGPKLTACPTASQVQSYAVTNIVGLSVPSSAFSLSTASSSCSGALVTAAYGVPTFTSGLGLPNITVHASACYPIRAGASAIVHHADALSTRENYLADPTDDAPVRERV
jgi:hypothetical protein